MDGIAVLGIRWLASYVYRNLFHLEIQIYNHLPVIYIDCTSLCITGVQYGYPSQYLLAAISDFSTFIMSGI